MTRIALCDDMIVHTKHILMLLDDYKNKRPGVDLCTESFDSGNKLIESINVGKRFDVFILDIVMPDLDGIMIARQIRRLNINSPLIFLTQSESYALDAFSVWASQYLIKPVSPGKLYPVLDKLLTPKDRDKDKLLTVSSRGRTFTLAYSNIIVIEYVGRCLHFHLITGEVVESKTIRTSFKVAVSEVLTDDRFLNIHQSFVINLDHVSELRSRSFLMINGMDITIPRLKYSAVKKAYLDYLSMSSEGTGI